MNNAEVQSILRKRALELAKPRVQQDRLLERKTLVCFELGADRFALHVSNVQEVLPLDHAVAVPDSPDYVLGIANWRGNILCLLDLKRVLGLPFTGLTNFNKVIVAVHKEQFVGLVVDRLTGVESVAAEELQHDPYREEIRNGYELGITRDGAVLIDVAHLFADKKLLVNYSGIKSGKS